MIFKSLAWKVGLVAAAIVIVYLGVVNWRLQQAQRKEIAAKVAALDQVAKLNDAIKVRPVKTVVVTNTKLVPFVEAAKKTDATVESHSTSNVTIKDTVTATPTATSWDDPHHRYHLTLPSGVFTRSENFKLEGVIVKGADGKTRYGKAALTEFDPVTGEALDGAGVKLDTALEVETEKAESAPVGLRLVAAVTEKAAFGLGVNVVDWHHADISVIGTYDRVAKKADGAVFVGYRVNFPGLDTNFAVGGTYSPFTRHLGAAVTLQISR